MNKDPILITGALSNIGALGVLFVAFKLLNITDVATWSWWLVTLPFWLRGALYSLLHGLQKLQNRYETKGDE